MAAEDAVQGLGRRGHQRNVEAVQQRPERLVTPTEAGQIADPIGAQRTLNCSQRIRPAGMPSCWKPLARAVIILGGPHM
jgi:hypothetical protein